LTTYNFSRCSILLAEDNTFIRTALDGVLRSLEFGQVIQASNGEEAIEYLKKMKQDHHSGPDFILSDLAITPINGLLLRWVRGSKDSLNRMVPFLIISGSSGYETINSARDLGVTEFIAKPFSVTSIHERILRAIDYPRQFVTTTNYFGPDRRRVINRKITDIPERRKKCDDDVIIVYSEDKKVTPKTSSDVWYWRLQNALRSKVAGGMVGPNIKGEIPKNLIEEAERQLDRSGVDFTIWTSDYIDKLSEICSEAMMASGNRRGYLRDIHGLALELRVQGATFGYPLITEVAKMLYHFTISEERRDDKIELEIAKCHIDAMRAVINDKIHGDGGIIGQDLLQSLKMSINKIDVVR
jgi:CheY-like chemotaxis protein